MLMALSTRSWACGCPRQTRDRNRNWKHRALTFIVQSDDPQSAHLDQTHCMIERLLCAVELLFGRSILGQLLSCLNLPQPLGCPADQHLPLCDPFIQRCTMVVSSHCEYLQEILEVDNAVGIGRRICPQTKKGEVRTVWLHIFERDRGQLHHSALVHRGHAEDERDGMVDVEAVEAVLVE